MDVKSTQTNPIQSSREPFDVSFYKQTEEFCAKIIAELPELHGVAIVPLWDKVPANSPPGLLRLRDPESPYLAALLQLLGRMAAFNVELHRDFVSQIQIFDNYARQLADKIKGQTEQLAQMQKETPVNTDEQTG